MSTNKFLPAPTGSTVRVPVPGPGAQKGRDDRRNVLAIVPEAICKQFFKYFTKLVKTNSKYYVIFWKLKTDFID